MIDVVGKYGCKEPNCKGIILYCNKDNSNELYCAKHKTSDSVVISDRRCIHDLCNSFASFNFDGLLKRIYCAKHKNLECLNYLRKHVKQNYV